MRVACAGVGFAGRCGGRLCRLLDCGLWIADCGFGLRGSFLFDKSNNIRFHPLQRVRLKPKPLVQFFQQVGHHFAHIACGMLEVLHCRFEMRLGCGIGFLIKGKTTGKLRPAK